MNGEPDQNDTAPNDAPGHDARVAYYTVQHCKQESKERKRNKAKKHSRTKMESDGQMLGNKAYSIRPRKGANQSRPYYPNSSLSSRVPFQLTPRRQRAVCRPPRARSVRTRLDAGNRSNTRSNRATTHSIFCAFFHLRKIKSGVATRGTGESRVKTWMENAYTHVRSLVLRTFFLVVVLPLRVDS